MSGLKSSDPSPRVSTNCPKTHTSISNAFSCDRLSSLITARFRSLAHGSPRRMTRLNDCTSSELVRGPEIEFGDFGQHPLKAVPGEWRFLTVKN